MNNKKVRSILAQMMALLLTALVVQTGVYLLVLLRGGVVSENEQNAFDIFSGRTVNRKIYLEKEMVSRWSNTGEGESQVLQAVRDELDAAGEDAVMDTALCQRVIGRSAPALVEMLRRNGVSGAFLVLDCPDSQGNYPGFYVRDYDPSSYAKNNADLLLERGLPAVARENAIAMNSYWSALFRMPDPTAENAQFFFGPLEAAKETPPKRRESHYFYRWSSAFSLNGPDQPVVAYSVPLILEDGTVLGVLGIDLIVEFLSNQLHYEELEEERTGAYFLGISTDGGFTYAPVCANGPSYQVWFGQQEVLDTRATGRDGIVTLEGRDGRQVYGAVQPLKLYNTNTPFEGEQWALIGMLEGGRLMRFARHIQFLLLLSAAGSLLLGLALVYWAARSVAKPITGLVLKLKQSDPDQPIQLGRIHTTEIDALTEAVENLSNAAAESAARFSKIIAMTHIPIGVFEYSRDHTRVFCSESIFTLLDWPEAREDQWLSAREFQLRMEAVESCLYDRNDAVYRRLRPDGSVRWIQLFYSGKDGGMLGAVQDVTRDMETKRKIAYERDFDILTGLYNRRAFDEHMSRLVGPKRPLEVGLGALLMFDLDNLKYVNDSYGHDYGDRYIQAFARSLKFFCCCPSVVGRRSGDEFNVFLHGGKSRESLRALVDEFWTQAEESCLPLPDGKTIRIRASGGLVWYPEDAEEVDELLRMADFAMYTSKHTRKGTIRELDRAEYAERAILIHGQGELNRLIESSLVRYALQPILSARDGSLYGYEMLMRPMVEQLANLESLFRLAKAQSKLYQMEKLTWFEALGTFARLTRAGEIPAGVRVFINSIGDQCLNKDDLAFLKEQYGDMLSRVVLEFTEGEQLTDVTILHKREMIRCWNGLMALDDYGSGYNSDSMLLAVRPQLVKIDISIVKNVDRDESKKVIFRNIVDYCRQHEIHTLAEGVETKAEMETVIRLGADYLQGFHIARPQFEPPQIPLEILEEIRAANGIA